MSGLSDDFIRQCIMNNGNMTQEVSLIVLRELQSHRQSHPERSKAILDISFERARQVHEEGWDAVHDDAHAHGQMATAAACYAVISSSLITDYPVGSPPPQWPWADEWWKPSTPRRNLEKAGALLVAEIERMDRAS